MESNSLVKLLVNQVKIGMAIKEKMINIENFIGHLESYDLSEDDVTPAIRGANIILAKLQTIYNNTEVLSYEQKIKDANEKNLFSTDVAFYKNLCQHIGVDDNDI